MDLDGLLLTKLSIDAILSVCIRSVEGSFTSGISFGTRTIPSKGTFCYIR